MPDFLITTKTSADLVAAAKQVLRDYQHGDRSPMLDGTIFDKASGLGYCQKNIRQLLATVAFGNEWAWGEASCCATSTWQRLTAHAWHRYSLAEAQPGDLIYMSTAGGLCHTCNQKPGHVGMVLTLNPIILWQNTSYQGKGLCAIPLRDEQVNRLRGLYRMFPLAGSTGPVPFRGIVHANQFLQCNATIESGVLRVDARPFAEGLGHTVHAEHLADQGKVYVD